MSTAIDRPTPPVASSGLRALLDDIRDAPIGREEARYLVDLYYEMQEHRKATANQSRALEEADESHRAIDVILDELKLIEEAIKRRLDDWTDTDPLSVWAKDQYGIGPVIAAGLAAHIDVRKARTAGAVWRFAGVDPTAEWKKGEKRPYNAKLKVLVWKIGDSFKKFSKRDDCFYGRLYAERKTYEVRRDEKGLNAQTAKDTLKAKNIRDKATRAIYEDGHLPAGRLDQRAARWAAKLFLAHYWEEGRRQQGLEIPEPYPIAHQDHAHKIEPPSSS